MKLFLQKKQNGFSLIETILYIGIIGGVFVALTSFILSISGSRNKSYAQQEVNANARLALSFLSSKIKTASGVNFSSSTFDANPGVLSLSMVSSTLNPTVISVENGRLSIIQGTTSSQYITSQRVNISNLVFTNLTASSSHASIGIDFGISYVTNTDTNFNFSSNFQTAVNLR